MAANSSFRARGGTYQGTLATDGNSYPVQLRAQGQRLTGTFSSGTNRFPLEISPGEEANQIVIQSDGTLFEMSREVQAPTNPLAQRARSPANPLAQRSQVPANPLARPGAAPGPAPNVDLSGTFNHPDGYFAMRLPPSWSAEMMSGDSFVLDTGHPNALTLVLMAELEPDEIGQPAGEIVKSAHEMIDGLLQETFGMYANSSQAEINLVPIGGLAGGISRRPAQGQDGPATVWQGVVVEGKSAFVMMSTMSPASADELGATLDAAMKTVRLNRSWELSQFVRRADVALRSTAKP